MPGFGPIHRLLTPPRFSAHLGRKRGIAMYRFARVFMSVLLLAAAGLGVGCGSQGTFNADKFWKEHERDQPGGGGSDFAPAALGRGARAPAQR